MTDKLADFLASVTTKEIISHGKEAKWKFVRGVEIVRVNNNQSRVSVVLVDSVDPSNKYQVTMNRVIGQFVSKPGVSSIATWEVDRVSAAKE